MPDHDTVLHYCPYHDRECTVPAWQAKYWGNYARPNVCIQEDDLTTLMLNRACETNHPFIAHLSGLAERAVSGRAFDPLAELSPDDLDRYLDGDQGLLPDGCTTVDVSELTDDQMRRWWTSRPVAE